MADDSGQRRYTIAGISGSLRRGSYNTATLEAARELMPDSMELVIITLHDIELFNADVEARGWPPNVAKLRSKLEGADAVLFATPEYNYSVPGVLKNAIDWLSRPERKSPIFGKPAAIVGASPSKIGTARAQAHLRQIAYYNGMPLMASGEVLISRAADKFDDDGRLTDQETRDFIAGFMKKFAAWLGRLCTSDVAHDGSLSGRARPEERGGLKVHE